MDTTQTKTNAVVGLSFKQWEKGRKAQTMRTVVFYVVGCSFASGSGMRVHKVRYEKRGDVSQAARFTPKQAMAIARQYRGASFVTEAR
jgi:hypothetical protein